MVQRPPSGTIPNAPGSYQFKDRDGRVIYVGKAKSLHQWLSNYFVNPATLPPRTASMVASAETVEWIQVSTNVDALMLENELIKRHQPRFNGRLRDHRQGRGPHARRAGGRHRGGPLPRPAPGHTQDGPRVRTTV